MSPSLPLGQSIALLPFASNSLNFYSVQIILHCVCWNLFTHFLPHWLVNTTDVYSPPCPINHHNLASVTQGLAPHSWSRLLSKWMDLLPFACYHGRLRRIPDSRAAKHLCFFDPSLHILSLEFMSWPCASFSIYPANGPKVQNRLTWMKIVRCMSIYRTMDNNLVTFICLLCNQMKNQGL